MKAKVNNQLLKTNTFDSGALGMLAMVLHQFHTAGHYQATIMQQGRALTEIDFVVSDKSNTMQLDIDLGQAAKTAKTRPSDCDCSKTVPITSTRVVSPKGYVLFHTSSGNAYSVIVSQAGTENIVFDSTQLSDGDLFAVSILEPATYSIINTAGSAKGEMVSSLTPEMAKNIKNLETLYVEVNPKKLDPEYLELTLSQGLVFRVKDNARIVIQKKNSQPNKPIKPSIHWKKL